MKKIISVCLMVCILLPLTVFAASYRDEKKIQLYTGVIEERASSVLLEKTLGEKIDLLVKIQRIIEDYESRKDAASKKDFLNFLYALEQYIEEIAYINPTSESSSIIITVIDDSRCNDCYTDSMVSQLQDMSFLSDAEFVFKDFSEEGVEKYLRDNLIGALPAIIFNTKDFDDNNQIIPYLTDLPNFEYSLSIGAKFDPFEQRSEKGFQILDPNILHDIQKGIFTLGDKSSEILWLEYSDLECPFCARLHNDGTVEKVLENYNGKVKFSFQHFPLAFHANAENAAYATQCIGDLYGEESFYEMINISFENMGQNNFSMGEFYTLAQDNISFVNVEDVKTCASREDIKTQVSESMSVGQDIFGVTGTPGNVLINTQTGEYDVISGAYPYSSFEELIERLLK